MQRLGVDLAAYAPEWVIASLCERWGTEDRPFALKRPVATLFGDVADFSEQTGRFASRGARGAEDLSTMLNGCFSLLIEIIHAYGGDIIAFAGDGIAVIWQETDLRTAALQATNCALALQEALRGWAQNVDQDMQLRISIEVGEALFTRVGGVEQRWQYLVTGSPLRLACANYRKAGIGQVVLCPAARSAIGDLCVGQIVDDAFLQVTRAPAPMRTKHRESKENPPAEDLERLVPKVVLDRAFFSDGRWLAEFRNLSIVSVQLRDQSPDDDLLEMLQKAILAIQTISARFEGMVLNVLTNEKGINAIIVFGLPPRGHSDNALRAVEAAGTLHRILKGREIPASIGVATGRLFCGECGGQSRRQYSILGQAINLSTRLMAVAGDQIVCDAATSRSVGRRVEFSSLGTIPLKGWSEPVPVYRTEAVLSPLEPKSEDVIIGRDAERQILSNALGKLVNREGQVIVIEGEAGIGKSRLLSEFLKRAKSNDCIVYYGIATAIERSTLYFAWRKILLQLIGAVPSAAVAQIEETLLAQFSDVPQFSAWAPLLDDIIHVGLAQTVLTQGISGAARASNIEQLIVHLVKRSAMDRPTLLAFDDLQWFDDASTVLLRAVVRRSPEVLVVATRRSDESATISEDDVFGIDHLVKLKALSEAAVAELVQQRLGVATSPAELRDFVHRHAGGNPFFCEELLLALRDTGAIELNHDGCRISGDLDAASRSALSASVEGAIVSRIDALPPQHQMALKVASAMSVEFSSTSLQTIYPDFVTAGEMRALLERLTALELLRVHRRENEDVYDFRHEIIRRVTYDELSFAQRRELHREIADGIEKIHRDHLGPFYAQLALHRELADQANLAIDYLDRAAEQALRSYANRDAIVYAKKALQLADTAATAADHRRRSVWEVALGDAHHELRDYEEASRHYEAALKLLGLRAPATRTQTVGSLLGNAARQLGMRIGGTSFRLSREQERADLQRAAHVYERLSEEYFYFNDSLRVLHGTLASLNLAEVSGSMAETISGYSGLALGLGMSGMTGAARYYSRRAFELARESGSKPEIARANLVAGVLASGLGENELAQSFAFEAAASFRELGDQARLQNVLVGITFDHLLHGDIARAERSLDELAGPDFKDANDTIEAWRLCARTIIQSAKGGAEAPLLSELRSAAEGKHASADRLLCLGVLASAHERRGERQAARESAERGFDVLRSCRVVWAAYGAYGAAGVVGTLIAEWERAVKSSSFDRIVEAKARAASRILYRAARSSPVCRPAALLHRGSTFFLSGNTQRAVRDWRRAVSCADDLHMQYFSGLAWLQIARNSSQRDAARDLALLRAEQAFQAVGATADLSRVRSQSAS